MFDHPSPTIPTPGGSIVCRNVVKEWFVEIIMNPCNYSIIPAPEKTAHCAICGIKINKLPDYHQITQLYICVGKENLKNSYIGLGLAVPVCAMCDNKISKKTKWQNRFSCCLFSFLSLVFILLLIVMRVVWSDYPSIFLGCAISIITIIVIISLIEKIFGKKSLSRVQGSVRDIIKHAIKYLSAKKWKRGMGEYDTLRSYTIKNLKSDLKEICSDGKLCILNHTTGMIVDIESPDAIYEIYDQSIYEYTYEPDG